MAATNLQDKLLQQIQAKALIDNLLQIERDLRAGKEVIYPGEGYAPIETPIDRDRIAQLTAAANISLKLLNKVLPDQKAVEVTDARAPELTDRERVSRIAALLNDPNTNLQTLLPSPPPTVQ